MRILIINTVTTERNGITNVILNLLQAMDKNDVVVDYVSINEAKEAYIKNIIENHGRIFVIPRKISKALPYIKRLYTVIRQEQYDIVHVHGNSATMVLEMVAAWLAGCKVRITHSHNTTCKYMKAHKLLMPLFTLLCTHRLACGEAAGKWLYRDRTFTVIKNGIRTEKYAFQQQIRNKIRSEYDIGENQTLIGHVGIFNTAKNQAFLLESFAKLKEHGKKYKLMLVGGGRLRPELEEKVRLLGLEKQVIFAGVTDHVQDYYAAFDLLVMPSLHEGLPLVLVEAQANGLPCIVSDAVTREADKTGLLTFLPLTLGAEKWAEEIEKRTIDHNRTSAAQLAAEKIKKSGYDIYEEAARLKEYYKQAVMEKN